MEYKISCIVPVYKAKKEIEKCVESIIFGQEKRVQVILIEDCSDDGSLEECKRLAEKYENVICIANEKNSGVSYTRNAGLARAEGEYIMFVDSDDWVSGRYCHRMLEAAEKYPDTLPICGFHFVDTVNNRKSVYKWNEEDGGEFIVEKTDFFEFLKKLLIQSPCNKIFKREIIRKNNILFDVHEFMGEDFRFVLDYLKASGYERCVAVNEPLYYYLRQGDSSLSGSFGLNDFENSIERLRILCDICGGEEKHRKIFEQRVSSVKNNDIFHICRNKKISKKKKLEVIEQIMNDGCAAKYYNEQRKLIFKENLVKCKNSCIGLIKRVLNKPREIKQNLYIKKQRKKLTAKDFSIISQNCIAGVFYHDMNMQFLTPTINLFFDAPDYLRFLSDLKKYLSLPIVMEWGEEYPIGYLDDVKIYFMHYHTCSEAKQAWEKRLSRINFDKLLVISTDRNGFDEEIYKKWCQLPFKKVLFNANEKWKNGENTVFYPNYIDTGFVQDLMLKREFYKDNVLINMLNSL